MQYVSNQIWRVLAGCWISFMLILFPVMGFGQSLEETLEQLSADAVRQYVAPISSAFGSNLNGAWFHKAPEATKQGFNFEVGLVAMGSLFPDDATHFSVSGQFTFSVDEATQLVSSVANPQIRAELIARLTTTPSSVTISGATVIGDPNDFITIDFPGGTYQTSAGQVALPSNQVVLPIAGFGELAQVNLLPLAAPQLSIGTLYGTQATFRYLPSVELNSDLGKLSYFGFGIQHNPFVWFQNNAFPMNVALGFYTQKLNVGDLFSTRTTAFGLNLSKQFGTNMLNFSPYAGFMLEKATMAVTYQYMVDTPAGPVAQDISLDIEGENKSRLILGASFRLFVLNLNVDYNLGRYNSITGGLNFAL